MDNILELFSGNKCFSKNLKKDTYNIISIDIEEKHNPTICIDITKWDYKQYDKNHFKFIWASPCCTTFSIACCKHRLLPDLAPLTQQARDANKMLQCTLDIINYFNCDWIIENPRGRMRHMPNMKLLKYRTLVYYGNYDYPIHKATDLWTSKAIWNDETKPSWKSDFNNIKRKDRSLIPDKLMIKLIKHFDLNAL